MRILLTVFALAAALSACSTNMTTAEQNAAAIRAFEPVNACGPGGTQDINQCAGHP